MPDSTRLAEGIDQEYQYVEERSVPQVFRQNQATYGVGTWTIPIGRIPNCKQAYVYRKKISGGTVTSVKLQGRKNDATGWADITTIADDTGTSSNTQDYMDFRFEVIIASSAVVLTIAANFDALIVKEAS